MPQRFRSIDFLRGFVILLMVVDHTRDIFSSVDIGTHIGTALPASYYFTRWITHICAPTFVFLSGLSIVLRQQRYQSSVAELQQTLVKRGLFIILFSITIISLLWTIILHDPVFTVYVAELSVIGLGMIFIALMLYCKPFIVLLLSLFLVAGHNLFDPWDQNASLVWHILHAPQLISVFGKSMQVYFLYPFLPWLGIAGLGYCLGHYFWQVQSKAHERKKQLISLALLGLGLFVVLRITNFYGDYFPFVYTPGSNMPNIYSFFDVTKYPPSLLYALLTLSPTLLILAYSDARFFERPNRFVTWVTYYGNAALFFYGFHLLLIVILAYAVAILFNHGEFLRSDYLSFSYLMTFIVIAFCYRPVRWFIRIKSQHKTTYPLLAYF